MKVLKLLVAAAVLGTLGACANVDTATRGAVDQTPLNSTSRAAIENQRAVAIAPSVNIAQINVRVPRSLRVSEANRYYPSGDIVWREDPIGDRHAQVAKVIDEGLRKGATRLNGERPVIIDVQVTRFHALTEKARYTVGGVHAIQFYLQVRDAQTKEILMQPRIVKADFDALGGNAAVQAEAKGITQRVRITDHLAKVLEHEMTKRYGYVAESTGVMGAINQL
ncbi:DUF6778 family protein [Nereida sp. MMG025]|uniref:DUF6778 family protein n=1 Tax=Nereida sp. MMG025 TaxID=2909981 RepID=UPI001F2237CB|nr:DUF6778 family protein [Nereida sp. MMG025]MCF6443562.1 hypothetical protein [Nereida sp. MMG025]